MSPKAERCVGLVIVAVVFAAVFGLAVMLTTTTIASSLGKPPPPVYWNFIISSVITALFVALCIKFDKMTPNVE